MKLGAVKKPAEIDWAAEFGDDDDDEFTVEETPEEDVEVEILLKQNREQAKAAGEHHQKHLQQHHQPAYSIRNGDSKLNAALSVPATSSMSIGRAGGATTETIAPSTLSSSSSSSSSSARPATAPPTTKSVYSAPMPRIDLDTQHVVEPSPYGAFLELRTMSFTIKLISIVHLMMSVAYILLPDFNWMVFPNLAVAAIGLWGAFAYSARITLAFMVLVCLNVMTMVAFTLIEMHKKAIPDTVLLVGFLFLVGELFILNYCYQFWKKLPSEGFFAGFRQFFSSNEARIGGMPLDEEEGL